MGMNFYLHKKNGTWQLPKAGSGERLERSMSYYAEIYGNSGDFSLNLEDFVEDTECLHIGKSSMGWHFLLCIYPIFNIYSLEDWKKLFNSDEYYILDEEDRTITADEMIDRITNRQSNLNRYKSVEEFEQASLDFHNEHTENKLASYDDYLASNHATRGLNGLWAHASGIDDLRSDSRWSGFLPICSIIYRTDGTYDLTPDWDFS